MLTQGEDVEVHALAPSPPRCSTDCSIAQLSSASMATAIACVPTVHGLRVSGRGWPPASSARLSSSRSGRSPGEFR
jgi:hypothetical protein